MSSRSRNGSGQRVPSPAVTRRHLRSHDLRTAFPEVDHFQDPRLLGRESSPRGIGRSISAPSSVAGTPRSFSRCYSCHADVINNDVITPIPNYVMTPYTSRSQESSPRTRMTSPSVVQYVNGDVNTTRTPPDRHRHKSNPDNYPPYVHFSESHSSLLTTSSSQDPRRRDPSPIPPGIRQSSASGMTRLQVTTSGSEDLASISPLSSDEATSSSTTRVEWEDGGGVGLEECEEGYYYHHHHSGASVCSPPASIWRDCLTCFLCGLLFRRPRILPCGHTFCTECLVQLKNEAVQEDLKPSAGNHSPCHLTEAGKRGRLPIREGRGREQKKGTAPKGMAGSGVGAGAHLVCPVPGCGHSLRLLNLGRWTVRNKAVSEAVSALRTACDNRQDACTQTDIRLDSVMVTIPRSFLQRRPPLGAVGMGEGEGRERRRGRSPSTVVDRVVHRALSMDCLNRHYYIPQPHDTWRSYLAMMGMTVLDQVLH